MDKQLFTTKIGIPCTSQYVNEMIDSMPVVNKPIGGGLWTSTYDPTLGSAWIQWCLQEKFQSSPWHGWILTPDPDARIYVIDTVSDLQELWEQFPWIEENPLFPCRSLDFVSIGTHYDAIHLTEIGQHRTRLTSPVNLYGWDCESTFWFRWKFVDVVDAGELHFESTNR